MKLTGLAGRKKKKNKLTSTFQENTQLLHSLHRN